MAVCHGERRRTIYAKPFDFAQGDIASFCNSNNFSIFLNQLSAEILLPVFKSRGINTLR